MAVDQHQVRAAPSPDELRERFAGGATRQQLAARLPDFGRRLAELEALVDLDPASSVFSRVRGELNVLAIVEGWCRDSRDGAAVLLRLLGDNPHVRVRFFLRGEHPELMAAYRKDGRFDSIPVFVLLDGDFNEIGRYVERPDEVTAMHQWHRAELARRDPAFAPAAAPPGGLPVPVRERLRAAMDELRERDRPLANARIAAALEAIAERAAAGTRQAGPAAGAVAGEAAGTRRAGPAAGAAAASDDESPQTQTEDAEPGAGEACPIEW